MLEEQYLIHHGIKGQKWGVRRYQNEDGTLTPAGKKKLEKEASKDAKEFARAKMFYGEGAGTRRKLIKAKVTEKSKNEYYKEVFDKALAEQDMAKHAEKAKGERFRADAKKRAGEGVRGAYHIINRDGAKVATWVGIGAAAVTAGIAVAKITGYDKKIVSAGKNALSSLKVNFGRKKRVVDYFK